jgi:8-oxo-dGTP diphosphatase
VLHGTAARASLVQELGAAGLHLTARAAAAVQNRPLATDYWLGVSAHDDGELAHAAAIGADFAVLGTVAATPSHPGGATLGAQGFAALVDKANVPVFAIGGMQVSDVAAMRAHGGQGIAAIRGLWPAD